MSNLVPARPWLGFLLLVASAVANEESDSCTLLQRAGNPAALQQEVKVNRSSAETRSDSYAFELNLRSGKGVTIEADPFDTSNGAEFGCGAGNKKCSCRATEDGFQMKGFGSENTWTGLDFTCRNVKFSMPGYEPSSCTCTYRAMIEFWGNGRTFHQQCSPKQCYKLVDYPGVTIGYVSDLLSRFENPNGGGPIHAVSWQFNIQADPLEPKKR